MHVATYYGNVTLVLILLQHGGSPDFTNVVSTLFSHLCYVCKLGEFSHFTLLSPRTLLTGLILTYPSIK